MRLGVFGGTFDPIHNMHIKLALAAKEQLMLDRVLIVTSSTPPHKADTETQAEMRFAMTRLAVDKIDGVEASRMELDRKGKSYTLYTLLELKEKYPNDEIFFIVGGDSLAYLDKWYHAEEFMKLCTFAVYPRGTDTGEKLVEECERLKKLYGTETVIISRNAEEISSTEIRNMVGRGEDISSLVPKKVYDYIKENNLYKQI